MISRTTQLSLNVTQDDLPPLSHTAFQTASLPVMPQIFWHQAHVSLGQRTGSRQMSGADAWSASCKNRPARVTEISWIALAGRRAG
ncbi:hypothetical protein PAPYR_8311 [Paratrimastix pyriformis]|uniref:Uncharacterized protein n=1 Tax=Paratrimastix pyriformis TaxID=342808 RepID=A0ABQ8UEE7_9EUKA|nr:hypothetical protein PAPYR_8311 [Paratrimastix pyriformis]